MPFSGIFFLPMIFLLSFSRFRRLASSHKKRIVKMEIPLHNSWSEWKYLSRLKTAPLEIKTEARAVRKQFARLIMTAPPCLCLSSLSIQEKPRDCNMGFSPKTRSVSEKKSAFFDILKRAHPSAAFWAAQKYANTIFWLNSLIRKVPPLAKPIPWFW